MRPSRTVIATALARGVRKRCPHCGQGRLFAGWAHHVERCPVCGLVYERNPGDTWAFTILLDRLPIGLLVVLVYLGIFREWPVAGLFAFAAIAAAFVWSSPNRWGAGIALHYLSRIAWPDPMDPVPDAAPPAGSPAGSQELRGDQPGGRP
jgi:uncharacterized protein (DUF983 family)